MLLTSAQKYLWINLYLRKQDVIMNAALNPLIKALKESILKDNFLATKQILAQLDLSQLKPLSELKDFAQMREYIEFVDALAEADDPRVMYILLRHGFPLAVLTEIAFMYPDGPGKSLLNILCTRWQLIRFMYEQQRNQALMNAPHLMQRNHGRFLAAATLIRMHSEVTMPVLFNFDLLFRDKRTDFWRDLYAFLDEVYCPDTGESVREYRFLAPIAVELSFVLLCLYLQQQIQKEGAFFTYTSLLVASMSYLAFIKPFVRAVYANPCLDYGDFDYDSLRPELPSNIVPPAPQLFRRWSVDAPASSKPSSPRISRKRANALG